MNYKFTKETRITYSKDFDKIFKHGKKCSSTNFFLCFIDNDKKYSRLGIIVKKKIVSQSVHRNRIKRLIRETYRLNNFKFQHNIDLIISVKKNIYAKKQQEVQEELSLIWNKVEIL